MPLIQVHASASVVNSLIWICSPWGSVMRTYHTGSAFIWTGSNFVRLAHALTMGRDSQSRYGEIRPLRSAVFIMTKAAPSRCSSRRGATISDMSSSALWTRLRPW